MHIPPESTGPEVVATILPRVLADIERNAARVRRRIEQDCDGDEALAQEREEKGGPIWG